MKVNFHSKIYQIKTLLKNQYKSKKLKAYPNVNVHASEKYSSFLKARNVTRSHETDAKLKSSP